MNDLTPPLELAAWLGCLVFMIALFNQLSKAWFTLRGRPSPSESAAAGAALSERIAKIENCIGSCKHEQDRRLDALEISQAAMRELVACEIDKVFNRVTVVADRIGELKGSLAQIDKQLDRIGR